MSGSRTKFLAASLALASFSLSAFAQNNNGSITLLPPPPRDASFTSSGTVSNSGDFSGLATAPPTGLTPVAAPVPVVQSAPVAQPVPALVATPVVAAPAPAPIAAPPAASQPASAPVATVSIPATTVTPIPASALAPTAPVGLPPPPTPTQIQSAQQAAATPVPAAPPAPNVPNLIATPVTAVILPNVSPESVGIQSTTGLGADMWKGTSRAVADALLNAMIPTQSPLLNQLAHRLLATAAIPPEGESTGQSLVSHRIDRLIAFADGVDAWGLAKQADAKLVDDITFKLAAENALTVAGADPCATVADFSKSRSGDWQKTQIICQLRAKDTNAAGVGLDIMRTQAGRDTVFIDIAGKNILAGDHKLPFQLTPLTAPSLALLQMAGLPLPNELYAHVDTGLIPGLLRTAPQQDIVQLALAESAAQRGLISTADLEAVYRSIPFGVDALNLPLQSTESGLRLRAQLFRAAEHEQDAAKRISYAVKFAQTAPAAFLYGAGGITADMIGSAKADPAMASNAIAVAKLYMIADKSDQALAWLRVAQTNADNGPALQALWPQFALAGLEPDSAFAADATRWLDTALSKNGSHDNARASLLLLDAVGFKVPDALWARLYETAPTDIKKITIAPVLFDRLRMAGTLGHKAESVLLAIAVAGNGEISLPEAITITRALREAGLRAEASLFARQYLAVMAP
jgi:hypothetical protein